MRSDVDHETLEFSDLGLSDDGLGLMWPGLVVLAFYWRQPPVMVHVGYRTGAWAGHGLITVSGTGHGTPGHASLGDPSCTTPGTPPASRHGCTSVGTGMRCWVKVLWALNGS